MTGRLVCGGNYEVIERIGEGSSPPLYSTLPHTRLKWASLYREANGIALYYKSYK